MTESALFEAQKQKLEGVCNENNLVFNFKRGQYPVYMVIRPLKDMDTQMSMLENVEDSGFTSPDAYISFAYKEGGVTRKYGGQFTITDTLQNKLERIFKKMCSYWLQYFFRNVMEENLLINGRVPYVDDKPESIPEGADVNNAGNVLPDGADPDDLPDEEDE